MGTNYYLHGNECAHCHRSDEPLHIGKSSAGWCFALDVGYNGDGHPKSLAEWREAWLSGVIRDEYGQDVTPYEMYSIITHRGWHGRTVLPDSSWYERNYAIEGPDGLARHVVGAYCYENAAGTYDLMRGGFS